MGSAAALGFASALGAAGFGSAGGAAGEPPQATRERPRHKNKRFMGRVLNLSSIETQLGLDQSQGLGVERWRAMHDSTVALDDQDRRQPLFTECVCQAKVWIEVNRI